MAVKGLSLAILLVCVVVASSVNGAIGQAVNFQEALVHCNGGADNQNCCKALNAAVQRERYCWSSLFGQIFIADLFKCGVMPHC
ncbi:hypothetical protein A4A49_41195 [Nicotiana attenuata]|uniref:Bifunctional inhibitor/plant lipid transfer protein/seed storage helical domain-containing protein n=1 Tax=Nicotiana attenuata TaxID=49451 RepID=A0A1J6L3N7_NICAT|nr:hypothetical protein A4A49_41195 [Nicotiana attenuata]